MDLVNLGPHLGANRLDLSAKIEVIRKNASAQCATLMSKSLAELVRASYPKIDLAQVEASALVFADGVSPDDGRVMGKSVLISFKNLASGHALPMSKPTIRIRVPSDLSYTAIERLSRPEGVLSMTSISDCRGARADDPMWVNGVEIR